MSLLLLVTLYDVFMCIIVNVAIHTKVNSISINRPCILNIRLKACFVQWSTLICHWSMIMTMNFHWLHQLYGYDIQLHQSIYRVSRQYSSLWWIDKSTKVSRSSPSSQSISCHKSRSNLYVSLKLIFSVLHRMVNSIDTFTLRKWIAMLLDLPSLCSMSRLKTTTLPFIIKYRGRVSQKVRCGKCFDNGNIQRCDIFRQIRLCG